MARNRVAIQATHVESSIAPGKETDAQIIHSSMMYYWSAPTPC